jgi:hypothetical protein
MPRAAWTTREDIIAYLRKLWDRGDILSSFVTGKTIFPFSMPVKGPASSELSDKFDEARKWAASLTDGAHSGRYRVETRSVNHRVLGRNNLPSKIWVDSVDDAVSLLRVRREAAAFASMLERAENVCPPMIAYLERYPMQALTYADDWARLIDAVMWVMRSPRPRVYLRQMDISGVDTKFLESRKGVLSKLLDLALPPDAIDNNFSCAAGFLPRYGFLSPPALIRLRLPLGCAAFPSCVSDVSIPADEFALLDLGRSCVSLTKILVTENMVNFLSIPRMADSILIWGAGYSFEEMSRANWMKPLEIFYWGDIDTHGFAILSQFRGYFPQTRSFLMDPETLARHKDMWVEEPRPATHDLKNLTEPESILFDDLRRNTFGERVRLEQERISYAWVEQALSQALRTS